MEDTNDNQVEIIMRKTKIKKIVLSLYISFLTNMRNFENQIVIINKENALI